jgi:class 3 adenylate cyclase
MVPRALRWAYRKLGAKYPRFVIAAQLQLAVLVLVGGLALLRLYVAFTWAEFWRLLLVAAVLLVAENVFAFRLATTLIRPAEAWLRGQRDPDTTVAAWRALVDLPTEFLRRWKVWPVIGTATPWSIYATWELGLVWYEAAILIGGCLVVLIYGVLLRFLAMELTMRPVLEDIASTIPDRTPLPRAGLQLKWKLLLLLPAINIITGVVVAGLSESGTTHLTDLGVDVAVAVGVSLTLSLELTVLLTRSILAPIQDLRDATRQVAGGDYTVRVPVLSTDETGMLARAFNDAVSGLEERERLQEAFGAYVDPEIAERVVREGMSFEGEEVEVTVLFLDIRDFTAFAEQASAREVVTTLNEFYDLVVPILLKHNGHANKFIGDGLLGVFGAPDRLRHHADAAVAAALETLDAVHRRYGGELRIGIGVNSGPVAAGTIGGGGRVEFTVIGDPVNTASRVEAVTREIDAELLITEATRCLLSDGGDGWDLRQADVELKGKTERVQLYAPRHVPKAPADEQAPDVARAS